MRGRSGGVRHFGSIDFAGASDNKADGARGRARPVFGYDERSLVNLQHVKMVVVAVAAIAAGCSERTGFLPNQDIALRRPEKQLVSDAMKRFPYKADAPKGTTLGRAEVDYMYRYVGVANLSEDTWQDAEVWVNRQYVVFVPGKWAKQSLKRLQFSMFRDERGNPFVTDKGQHPVKTVDVYMGGKMYEIPVVLAE